jgi:lipooligosaccharide transport system permease protein
MALAPASLVPAARVLQRNLWVYRRTWRGSIFGSFLTPFLYLGAMGIGLGTLIQQNDPFGGYDYLHFLGPGILAATCMQSATFESTFPIMSKIMWRKNYDAMLSTPLEVRHLVAGELLWIGFRVLTISVVFLAVMTIFGIPRSPLALLAVPGAMLTGLSFSAAVIAFAATQRNDAGFAWLFRFVINPLFLFSGTFFPVERLPDPIEWVAAATPLYHGVALVRGAILADAGLLAAWPLHVAYLVAFLSAAALVAHRLLRRRLVK